MDSLLLSFLKRVRTHCRLYIIELITYVCVCVFTSEEDNLQGWFFAEDDGNQIKKQKHPLLLRQMPVVMSKLQEFKVGPSDVISNLNVSISMCVSQRQPLLYHFNLPKN